MPHSEVLVPLVQNSPAYTARLGIKLDPDRRAGGMVRSPLLRARFQNGFLGAVERAYTLALNVFGLSPEYTLEWTIRPCGECPIVCLEGASAGAAFLLSLLKLRNGFSHRDRVSTAKSLDTAIASVALGRIGVTAQLDAEGSFKSVGDLSEKLSALLKERPLSHIQAAVIAAETPFDDLPSANRQCPWVSIYRDEHLDGSLPVIRVTDAEDCYRKLFRLQSEQMLL